jgi:hypothetical protein
MEIEEHKERREPHNRRKTDINPFKHESHIEYVSNDSSVVIFYVVLGVMVVINILNLAFNISGYLRCL